MRMHKIYWEFVRNLRNEFRKSFVEQSYIGVDSHEAFMSLYSSGYLVCLNKSEPIGFIGVKGSDIRFAVAGEHQGKGIGVFMLEEISRRFPNSIGKIKIDNKASIRTFEKAGFKKTFVIMEKNEDESV